MNLFFTCLIHTAVSFVATTAFAMIFHAPKDQRYFAGITGAFGWLIYVLLTNNAMDTVGASFFATVGLTAIARIFSYRRRSPVSIFLITGVFPLVPGAGIYSTGYAMFMGDTQAAINTGLITIQIAIVMAVGMGLVLSMPQVLFSFRRIKKAKDGVRP